MGTRSTSKVATYDWYAAVDIRGGDTRLVRGGRHPRWRHTMGTRWSTSEVATHDRYTAVDVRGGTFGGGSRKRCKRKSTGRTNQTRGEGIYLQGGPIR
eukprot:1662502-Pyramimonas_sp.AAC.1